ncbi:hypothetical protein [Rhizobium sp. BK418]|uniref:hypothetical protein n=1 Tax=Rhizobium sp. BK418 TaxID=2512120 RepID=UPI001042FCD5|nr:hypothetical protein [Rhizobium sp. BK418]
MSSTSHPDRFIPVSDGSYARYKSIMRLSRKEQDEVLGRERAILRDDTLGLIERESLWAAIHDVHRALKTLKGQIIEVPSYPSRYRDSVPFSGAGLPKAFFLNFGNDCGLEVDGDHERFIEGTYFVACTMGGKTGYRYVVVSDTPHDMDGKSVPLGVSLLEQTRVAIGFVELGHTLDESINRVTGDPLICSSVQHETVRGALNGGIDLVSRLSMNIDVPTNAASMRLVF